jgi:phosphoribosylformylglycinamidine cyclo-ligase
VLGGDHISHPSRDAGAYAAAGVDIAAGEQAVALMQASVRATYTPDVLGDVGGFGALYRSPGSTGQVLVSSTDSVGTKVKLAIALGRHGGIGRDLVHHCINDILTLGARPLFFLDYLGVGRLVPQTVAEIVGGLAEACRQHGVALIGGETAELPDLYARDDYDLAGFIVGVVAEHAIVDGHTARAGDVVIGLPSDGLHTNGYTLARRVFAASDLCSSIPALGGRLGDALLRPHRCYLPEVGPLLGRGLIKGMAHITGGGLPGNLPRALPAGLGVALDQEALPVPSIFRLIEETGAVPRAEMYRVFNMGIGFALVCAPASCDEIVSAVAGARVIGRVVRCPAGERVLGLP